MPLVQRENVANPVALREDDDGSVAQADAEVRVTSDDVAGDADIDRAERLSDRTGRRWLENDLSGPRLTTRAPGRRHRSY